MAEQRISDDEARILLTGGCWASPSTVSALARDLLAARVLLREIEWKGWPGMDGRGCPCCEEEEHTPESCRLAALIGGES